MKMSQIGKCAFCNSAINTRVLCFVSILFVYCSGLNAGIIPFGTGNIYCLKDTMHAWSGNTQMDSSLKTIFVNISVTDTTKIDSIYIKSEHGYFSANGIRFTSRFTRRNTTDTTITRFSFLRRISDSILVIAGDWYDKPFQPIHLTPSDTMIINKVNLLIPVPTKISANQGSILDTPFIHQIILFYSDNVRDTLKLVDHYKGYASVLPQTELVYRKTESAGGTKKYYSIDGRTLTSHSKTTKVAIRAEENTIKRVLQKR